MGREGEKTEGERGTMIDAEENIDGGSRKCGREIGRIRVMDEE